MKITAVFLMVLVAIAPVPAAAAAQAETPQPATTFAELVRRGVLEEGNDIAINFRYEESAEYVMSEAEVVQLSDAAIVVRVNALPAGRTNLPVTRERNDSWRLEIPEHRVQSIVLAGKGWSRGAGGAVGGLVGLVGSSIVAGICSYDGSGCSADPGVVVLAGIGAGVGLGVLLTGKSDPETVFVSSALPAQFPQLRWSVAPVVAGGRKGAAFTIRW